jgi:glyoxylase-like metal-dependent hydrolase (beta-lactamase superfamily II)
MQRIVSAWLACTFSLACMLLAGCQRQTGSDRTEPDPAPGQNRANPSVDFENVKIEVVPVAGSVYMLLGAGGNIGISAGADGVLMIDDQFAPLAPKIREAIAGIAGDKPGVEFLINTHYHGDHSGGNPEFGQEARIVAHTNVRKRVSTSQTARGRTFEALPAVGWPIITFDESLSIHFNGEEVKVMHAPRGHTDGDSVVFFTGAKVIHMGDLFFHGKFPFLDLESGGDVESYVANVAKVLEMAPADAKIIPGHGPLATVADLRAFHQTLTETIDIVREHMDAGKTLQQIQTAGLPAKYKSWGEGFIDSKSWIATVHASLSR